MTFLQKMVVALLPKHWSDAIKAESQTWFLQCSGCDTTRSIWELGGMRYKGTSQDKRKLVWCTQCRKMRWMALERKAAG